MPLPKRVTAPSGNHPGCSVGTGVGVRVGVNVAVGIGVEVEFTNVGETCGGLVVEASLEEHADINSNEIIKRRLNTKNIFFHVSALCFGGTKQLVNCFLVSCHELTQDYRTSPTKTQPTFFP
jgi:hypothetical protein